MNKNVLIIGPARSGKTTLSRKISKKYGYNIISLDDIICAFEELPDCNIKHDGNDDEVSKNFVPFLKRLLKELSEGSNYYNNCKYVIEGTHIDFEQLIPYINEKLQDKYFIIGLTFNKLTSNDMFKNIRKYDTEDDWTYYINDDDLMGDVNYFIEKNKSFANNFKKYNIKTYDVSSDRENKLNEICDSLKDQEV